MGMNKKEDFFKASRFGDHKKLEEYLLAKNNKPTPYDVSAALQSAAANGHAECVRLLIQCNVSGAGCRTEPLKWSAIYEHLECLKLLIPVSDIDLTIENLRDLNMTNACNLIESFRQQDRLFSKIQNNPISTRNNLDSL